MKETVLPAGWICRGNRAILERPIIMLLLSRQSRTLTSSTWWFRMCRQILSELASEKVTILVGDTIFYQQVVRYLVQPKFSTIVMALDPVTVSELDNPAWLGTNMLLFPENEQNLSRRKSFEFRDRTMAGMADILVGIAIRRNGHMIARAREAGKQNIPLFVVVPLGKGTQLAGNHELLAAGALTLRINLPSHETTDTDVSQNDDCLCSERSPVSSETLDGFLWHYTRSSPGPWPDQTWTQYIDTLIEADPASDHDAGDTLRHILTSQKIYASGTMIRGGYPVVCFSEITPAEMSVIRRYHRSLIRWNFQPFGMGIRKSAAEKLGARPVRYGSDETFRAMKPESRFLFQKKRGSKSGVDWRQEKEWRIRGDVDLSFLGLDDSLVFVRTAKDAQRISPFSRFPVITVTDLAMSD